MRLFVIILSGFLGVKVVNFDFICLVEFGKLPSLDGVVFGLKPEPDRNRAFLEGLSPAAGKPHLYIGCTGWGMKEWVGSVYPKGTRAGDFLEAYGKQFNTIELNTTHYRIPDADTVANWYANTPADFRFCPKIPQSISHSRDLGFGSGQVLAFCESVQLLREKLGPCFLQLSPHFDPEKLPLLERFLDHFPRHIPLGVEFRHPDWFADPEWESEVFDLLAQRDTGAVITDVAGRRDAGHMHLSAPFCLIRFVGNGLHPTDYSRIDEWVDRLAIWFERGLRQVFFFTHEPDNLLAPELSVYLCQQAEKRLSVSCRGPVLLQDPPPQLSLF